ALEERGGERQLERAFAGRPAGRGDERLGGMPADPLELHLVLVAVLVEHHEALAGAEAQRAEVAELRTGDPDARALDVRARDEEAEHQGARSSTSVRHSSSARVSTSFQPGQAARTRAICVTVIPDSTSRPPGSTTRARADASATIASASRFAT